MNNDLFKKIIELANANLDFIIVTLVNIKGSAPQVLGAKMLVGRNGLIAGTIGGGKVELKAIERAKLLLTTDHQTDFCEWNLQTDVKMTCGGVVNLYFEKMKSNSNDSNWWTVAIFGAGHVAQEVVSLLLKLDCQVKWIDPRRDWLDKIPDHSRLQKIHIEDMKSYLDELPSQSFIASMTMGHAYDLPILIRAFNDFQFPYVGVIGSESKAVVLKSDLLKNGVRADLAETLYCPIGESFGNNSPVEIALSIVAQLVKMRDLRLKN